ncbi:gamma-interferon-inducible lysosomal thiol reductase-like [Colias croceus]|uniref:gamma-interferon-inducible lysosomal thiol reductase-like n=1 Tax=Colias crocea TaxID=72248 RepID=UPI001E2815DA|nr:gamma-interferon-inducible lysosomal thiol reductase-like [Colias croceus]
MKTLIKYFLLMSISLEAHHVYASHWSNFLTEIDNIVKLSDGDKYLLADKQKIPADQKIEINVYYESHCPGCREFISGDFKKLVEKLYDYLNIKTYPFGNAEMDTHGGKVEFRCQHGPKECYGNKLHACALDIIKNHRVALIYNSCMASFSQDDLGSDDAAAAKCGTSMKIKSNPIINCANSDKGDQLLKYYGEESKKANYHYVPYILVNGKEYNGDHIVEDICAMFSNPPPPCSQ